MSGFVRLNGETDGESEQGRQRRQGAPNIGLSAAIDVDAAAAVLNDRKSSGTEQIGLTYVRCSQPNMLTWSDSEENAKA